MTRAMIGKQTPKTMAVVSLPDELLAFVEDVTSGVGDVEVLLFIIGLYDDVDCKTDIIVDKRMFSEEDVDDNDNSDEFDAFSNDVNSELSVVVWMPASVAIFVGVCLIASDKDGTLGTCVKNDEFDDVDEVILDDDEFGDCVKDSVDKLDMLVESIVEILVEGDGCRVGGSGVDDNSDEL